MLREAGSWRLPLALVAGLALTAGCAGSISASTGLVRIECATAGAMVYIDDRLWGSARDLAARGMALAEGRRRLEVKADGYFSVEQEVVVRRREVVRLEIELRRIPPGVTGW